MRTLFQSARVAVGLLTRVPVGSVSLSPQVARGAAAWFPVVGFALGGALGLLWRLTLGGGGPWVAAVVVVGASVWLTGAFHEDGLADTADALGGARDREQVFRILKDSRIGTFGASALFLSLLLRVVCLARLGDAAPLALLFAHGLGRLAPVWVMVTLPYVTPVGSSRSAAFTFAGPRQAGIASAWVALALVLGVWCQLLGAGHALALGGVLVLVTAWLVHRFLRRVGGFTGDFLGASEQLAEMAVLLVWVYFGAFGAP